LADLGAAKWMQSRLVFPEIQPPTDVPKSKEGK